MNQYSKIITRIECEKLKQEQAIHIWIISTRIKPTSSHPAIYEIIKNYISKDFSIIKNDQGKPFIKSSCSSELHISIAHSNTILVIALSFTEPIGVDIEQLKERAHIHRLKERYFSESTPTLIDFYRSWTAREAFIKLLGQRLFSSLKNIQVMHGENISRVGLDTYSHNVVFHQFDSYVLATCFKNSPTRSLKYFYI